ncbi:MAG: peptidase [Desulfuromonas sp.]|nr:MAG: peptidase [Desulfuromonas sp.]
MSESPKISKLSAIHIPLCLLISAAMLMLTACTANGIFHTVKPGQTLYQIAQTYQVDEQQLAKVNRIDDPRKLRAGQRLYLPGVSQAMKVPATVTAKGPEATSVQSSTTASHTTSSKQLSEKNKPTVSSRSQTNSPTKTVNRQQSTKPKPASVKGLFDWPLKGAVLNSFGSSGDAAHKGIEISARQGTAVQAAAPGKVIYSGNAIRGYGNLIIIEHSDNYFSVYGYNQKNLVAQNDFVGKGDRIALSGAPPNGRSARLHFEIRRGKEAVDPSLYLP